VLAMVTLHLVERLTGSLDRSVVEDLSIPLVPSTT
jgi:hypothetical protein